MKYTKLMKLFGFVMIACQFTFPQHAHSAEPGDTLVVCSNTNYGSINAWRFTNLRAKLANPALFGPNGSLSRSRFRYVITTPTTANLRSNNCDIWFSGWDPGTHYNDLAGFIANDGFVMGGCDASSMDAPCGGVGYPVKNYRNITVTFAKGLDPINPLTCNAGNGGAPVTIRTAGGASAYFTSGIPLARYTDAAALPEVITDSLTDPSIFLTADINMWDAIAGVTAGSGVNSDQDKFAVNSFKFAADAVTGLISANRGTSCEIIPDDPVVVPSFPPVATAASASVVANAIASINLVPKITDRDGDQDLRTIDLNPAATGVQRRLNTADGVWTVTTAGLVRFNPDTDFEGTSTIRYTVQDDEDNTSKQANITVTVAGARPVATNVSVSVGPDTNAVTNLVTKVSDANNDVVMSTLDLNLSAAGTQRRIVSAAGVWTVTAAGVLTFNPAKSFEGASTVSYAVKDDDANQSNTARVSVTVAGATPVASNASTSVAADTNAVVNLVGRVSDANDDVAINTVDLNPSVAGIQRTLNTAAGAWSVNTLGVVAFNPSKQFDGSTSIRYTVRDDDGNQSAPASISITVAGAAPVASNAVANVEADTNAVVNLTVRVTDSNDDVDISSFDINPALAGVQKTLTTADGVWSVSNAGILTFNPTIEFDDTAVIRYTVKDDSGNQSAQATVSVTVAGAAPVAGNSIVTVSADTNGLVNLAFRVSDVNGDVDITTIDLNPGAAGVQKNLNSAEGVWSVNDTGQLTFDPVSDFEGVSTINYTVQDAKRNLSAPATVWITVRGAAPVATNDVAVVLSDTDAEINLANNVSDANDDVDITTLDLNSAIAGIQKELTTEDGVWTVTVRGVVTFNPDSDFEGASTITYTVEDEAGNQSNPASVSVTVGGATPVVVNDSMDVSPNTDASFNLVNNASDQNNDIDIDTFDIDTDEANVQKTLTTADGVWVVNSAGMLTFNPDTDFEGTSTISYTVQDDDGNQSAAASISATVAGATPVATNASASALADTNIVVDLSEKVTDANNDIDLNTIDLNPDALDNQQVLTTGDGTWSVSASGVLTFDPDLDFEGSSTLRYSVQDDDGNQSAAASVSVTIAGAFPVATNDTASVDPDTNGVVNLANNVSDANNDIDIKTIDLDPTSPDVQSTFTTEDGVWSVTDAAVVTFNPNSDFEGVSTVAYTVRDDDGNQSAPASVSVTVAGAIPTATNETSTVIADANAQINLSDNVADANNDIDIATLDLDLETAGIQSNLSTPEGIWSVSAAGQVTFNPEYEFEGPSTLSYTISDDDGNVSAPAQITVTVGGATPMATDDTTTVEAGAVASLDISDNVSDANNDIDFNTFDIDLSRDGVQNRVTDSVGVWAVDSNGIITLDPNPVFEGTATLSYTVRDDDGNQSIPASVSIVVGGATPVAETDSESVLTNTNAVIDLSDNVSDDNNDVVIASIDLDPDTDGIQKTLQTEAGLWTVSDSGVLVFDPTSSVEGPMSILYTVSDDDGNVSLPADVTVTVGSAVPVADDDTATIVQNNAITIDVLDGDNDANNNIVDSSIDLDPDTEGTQSSLSVDLIGTYEVVDGQVLFTPVPSFHGTTSTSYTVNDVTGNTSNVASIEVVVQLDSDGDGSPNLNDVDDDNDGIPDLQEGDEDTDGDGVIDSLDRDSDNDGLSDTTEAQGSDVDGNGVIDGFTDADGDGHDDSVSATPMRTPNSDDDLWPDYKDLDSDNDGLTDLREAGGTDSDGDGLVDDFADENGNGFDDSMDSAPLPLVDLDEDNFPDYIDKDSDNDGLTDAYETGNQDEDTNGEVDDFVDENNDGLQDAIALAPIEFPDSDADELPDYRDLDSDNDTIPDAVEGSVDTDADGMPDYIDTDSDADGISDQVESGDSLGTLDSHDDGIPDHLDVDSDDDGIPDAIEGASDTDSDELPDYLDLDSDNDGIYDNVEAQLSGLDTNNNGIDDTVDPEQTGGLDTDGNGVDDSYDSTGTVDSNNDGISDVRDPDSDADGIPDAIEGIVDTDEDGIPDYLDLDSDNDGISDGIEAQISGDDADADGIDDSFDPDKTGGVDEDEDGVDDQFETSGTVDTDNDGFPDALEQDSDNDGIPDSLEVGPIPLLPLDSDGDGAPDYIDLDSDGDGVEDLKETDVDSDSDGIADYLDNDADNDGLGDSVEGVQDSDGDGTPNFLDTDSDNDGIPDKEEGTFEGVTPYDRDDDLAFDFLDIDSDNDGISDITEGFADTDGDGVKDFRDLDVDNDGIFDLIEVRVDWVEIAILDANGDGVIDSRFELGANGMADIVETEPDSGAENYELSDKDSDGVFDFRDLDSDNDGLLDTTESDHEDEDLNGVIDTAQTETTFNDGFSGFNDDVDRTASGVAAGAGNLPRNSDEDFLADFRDPDSDNDGLMDIVESFGLLLDQDNDGAIDDFSDSDGDGVSDAHEEAPVPPVDTDSDGMPDALEVDSDGDGLTDSVESGGLDIDGNGRLDDFQDSDNDGIDDGVEVIALRLIDTDKDGLPDYRDLDSDGDGLTDLEEGGAPDIDGDGAADELVASDARPDFDGDGVPDHLEAVGPVSSVEPVDVVEPVEPAEPVTTVEPMSPSEANEFNDGTIQTGLSGNGCSITPRLSGASGQPKTFDPLFLLFLSFSLLWLFSRRYVERRAD